MRRPRKLPVVAATLIALLPASALLAAGPVGPAADAADAGPRRPQAKNPPDPPALVSRAQWVYVLRWEKGEIYLADVHQTDLGEPRPTPRAMGRFALELYEGKALVERVRFDFPMLGAPEDAGTGYLAPPRFEPKLRTRIGVLFPVTTRGTRLDLVDRATGERWALPWPPVPGPGGGLGPAGGELDGGADAGADGGR